MRLTLTLALLAGCATELGDLTCADNLHDWWPTVEVCFDGDGIPRTIAAHGDSTNQADAATDLGVISTPVPVGDEHVEIEWPPGVPQSLGFGCCVLWQRD